MTRTRRPVAVADERTKYKRTRRVDERVSLHPLTFEEALGGLLAVDPKDEEAEVRDGDGS